MVPELTEFSDHESNLEAHFALHTLENKTKFSRTEPLFAKVTHKGINHHGRETVQILEHGICEEIRKTIGTCDRKFRETRRGPMVDRTIHKAYKSQNGKISMLLI